MDKVEKHYSLPDLGERILAALREAGLDTHSIDPDDVEQMDTIHNRGSEATSELADLVGFAAEMRVLDVGCGLGGPSRYLARRFGCHVTGIDLTEAYCRAAEMLAERMGLAGRVAYRRADALDLPFADAAFDVVWTEHAAMNIEDKARLYAEIFRVLRPGGKFALYDVVKGPGGPVEYPVPWAGDASISFLATPEEVRDLLRKAGFRVLEWRDATPAMFDFFRRAKAAAEAARAARKPPPPGRGVVGIDTSKMMKNHEEKRTELLMAVFERPG